MTLPGQEAVSSAVEEKEMGKIVRHEFVGSGVLFVLLCITIIGIPGAILYLIEHVVTVEEEMENPSEFLNNFRIGKFDKRKGK